MARIRKENNRIWTKEEKYRIIKPVLEFKISGYQRAKECDISDGMLFKWLKSEMKVDFNEKNFETVYDYIASVIFNHNNLRPSYALKYKTPIEYRTQLGFT